ncbi:hypothetical protein JCM9152_453 [Halalkalibacter hemicellulosilyticusJCM 9152]|uniref:Uncharacterized protein n=1 Tax=Halalkalibacter hemicellulosilyticusJCM 9152 TaxID=1236971 RepID=W4QAW7_9BACI|nr:hypothetical protein JCM9152_453 [Halalkalibacter hemicellulosilyticusJCM 9152]
MKTSQQRECKSCRMVDIQADWSYHDNYDFETVTKEEFEERVSICLSCPSLLYKSTCAYSGEWVAYRAHFKSKSCPHPAKSKWL